MSGGVDREGVEGSMGEWLGWEGDEGVDLGKGKKGSDVELLLRHPDAEYMLTRCWD